VTATDVQPQQPALAGREGAQRDRRRLIAGVVAGIIVAAMVSTAGVGYLLGRSKNWSARAVVAVLPSKNIDVATAAGYYDTLSRGQIVTTVAEILRLPRFKDTAADKLHLAGPARDQVSISVDVIPNTALAAVTATAPNRGTAEAMADGVVSSATGYIGGLSSPYDVVPVSQAAGESTKGSGLHTGSFLLVLAVAALAAGVAAQQAVYALVPLLRRRKAASVAPPSTDAPAPPGPAPERPAPRPAPEDALVTEPASAEPAPEESAAPEAAMPADDLPRAPTGLVLARGSRRSSRSSASRVRPARDGRGDGDGRH
jgi:capsular polysaccharide biosynthesis protein